MFSDFESLKTWTYFVDVKTEDAAPNGQASAAAAAECLTKPSGISW